MSQSNMLRENKKQHKPKNKKSKKDDKNIYLAMQETAKYIEDKFDFSVNFANYEICFEKNINYEYMINFIKRNSKRKEFDNSFNDRNIKPDGGILSLIKKDEVGNVIEKFPILISEIKRQGTNDARLKEGKKRQATGNAIERLGKNLTGIKAMMASENITPFVCFGWGCDFAKDSKTVLSKVIMMNEFYPLNKIYIWKRDGFSPVSMFFREEIWTSDEMIDIMKEIAEASIRYYLY